MPAVSTKRRVFCTGESKRATSSIVGAKVLRLARDALEHVRPPPKGHERVADQTGRGIAGLKEKPERVGDDEVLVYRLGMGRAAKCLEQAHVRIRAGGRRVLRQ